MSMHFEIDTSSKESTFETLNSMSFLDTVPATVPAARKLLFLLLSTVNSLVFWILKVNSLVASMKNVESILRKASGS